MLGGSARPGLAVVVVACLVIGSLGLVAGVALASPRGTPAAAGLPTASSTPAAAHAGPSSSAVGLAHAAAVENALRAKGISPASVHLPNFGAEVTSRHQPIQPSYTQAPAPMGVADIGLRNQSGTLVPYELNTTSVAGTVNITNLQSLYVDGDGPDTYGIQLNSVVNGVTIFGNSSYQFWSQNYIGYTPSQENLTFGDEVWNFSSPSGYFPQNGVYNFSSNGTFSDFPDLYQGYGPSITIGYPFTLILYLNTSTMGDRPALYFNYTVSNATFRQSASFDYLVFNSTVGTPTRAAPVPYYQADGFGYDPIGLPNDMEIDILGNDDGDMTAFTAANATVSLQYWNATTKAMEEVPSAFNAGQETGENAVGLLVYSNGGTSPIALVQAGPGFVGGLWNYSAYSGAVTETVTVHPLAGYSFLFVNVGSTDVISRDQWVPTSTTGTTTFYLPKGGTYFLEFMMSEYAPATQVVTATANAVLPAVHLAASATAGIYTPLFALDNAELALISSAGAGTVGNPYIVLNNQHGSLAPQFAPWNDFLFPEFPGLLIAGTTDYVEVTPPSFEIDLPTWDFVSPYVAGLGLPLTNNLQIQFYDAANIELVQAPGILGWLSSFLAGFPESSVIFWNCTNSLVLSNVFDDQGNALLLYGGTNITIWGNTFVSTPVAAANPLSVDGSGGWDTGVNETESGDLLYNNQFEVGVPAITVTFDPFGCDQYGFCEPVVYTDTWNVSLQPASNYTLLDGWNLTGSIIGTSYQGGNFWSNYGLGTNPYGVLPYNNSGAITAGGDYVPLVSLTLYPVSVHETGLPTGATWTVAANGAMAQSNGSTVSFDSPNGTFDFTAGPVGNYSPVNPPASFTVDGAGATVEVNYSEWVELVSAETTLAPAVEWSVSVTGGYLGNATVANESTTPEVNISLPVGGPYNVSAFAPGYVTTSGVYKVTIPNAPYYRVVFGFELIPGVLNVSVTPSAAQLWVNGTAVTLVGGTAALTFPVGVVSVEASASGYTTFFTNVSIATNTTTWLSITLKAAPSSSSGNILGISTSGWAVIIALAVLAVALFAGLLIVLGRRPKQGQGSPGPAQAWQEPPSSGPPPP